MGKPIRLEPLHPATLVVDGDQQIRTQGFDAFAQRSQLRAAFPIATEQNQPAHQRVAQPLPVRLAQGGASNVNDQRGLQVSLLQNRGRSLWMDFGHAKAGGVIALVAYRHMKAQLPCGTPVV